MPCLNRHRYVLMGHMTLENPQENPLVGLKHEDMIEKAPEDITADGQPIYMAFLEDPNDANVSLEEIQEAKNAAMNAKEDLIDKCRLVPFNECIEEVKKTA